MPSAIRAQLINVMGRLRGSGPEAWLQGVELRQGLLRPPGIAQGMDKFQGAKGIKPLVELTLELRARLCLSLTVGEG